MKQIIIISFFSFLTLLFAMSHKGSENVDSYLIHNLESMSSYCDSMTYNIGKKESLIRHYLELRESFKKIEFIIAFVDYQAYLKNFNGAPLPKLEKKVPDLRIIEPKGLQVIDELVFSSDTINKEELISFIKKLKKSTTLLIEAQVNCNKGLVLNAAQLQWVRNYTLGITGFDTPGSLKGIEDTKNSCIGLMHFLEQKVNNKLLVESLRKNINYLNENKDFEKFNRLEYYKLHWQPFYEELIHSIKTEGIKNLNAINPLPIELNAKEPHLFTSQIFNKEAFVDFNSSYDNKEVRALGELLFFDPILSSNRSMSCGTCHQKGKGFSDGLVKSVNFAEDGTLDRNSPGLVNAIYTKGFFYDLRASKLSQQFEHVIFNENEFNTTLIDILDRLSASNYKHKFEMAFPSHKSEPVNTFTFKTALSVYLSSLEGFESEFDLYMRGEIKNISNSSKRGYNLFMGKANCATCHFAPTFAGLVPPYFNDSETEVLGVPKTMDFKELDSDMGRYSKKKIKEYVDFYKHSFKTTTVRNASLTAPYMHNGVFKNLEDLIDFYNEGGGVGRNLYVPNQTLGSDKINLTKKEVKDIIEFINALAYVPK